ncbi:DUF2786 domain-containing protein [Aerococcaceae bacterium WGS1372]
MSINDKILDKIRNLLSLAEDGGNDEESQTALLMAQKLMLKHKISQDELNEGGRQEIVIKSLSVYKRLYWWEKILVKIIAENFRVMFYVQSNRLPHQKSVQRKLVLMGYPEDVELAYEVFYLAAESMKHYAGVHIKENTQDTSKGQAHVRKSYYQGFMDGLQHKFAKQREEMADANEKYALIIQVPQDVVDKFNQEINGSLAFKRPNLNRESEAYYDGYDRGSTLSLTNKFIETK